MRVVYIASTEEGCHKHAVNSEDLQLVTKRNRECLRLPSQTCMMPSASGTATPTTTTHGSQTILQTSSGPANPTLRLRAPDTSSRPRVQWAEDVVDNEGMGKKKSKVCCIYHKPHEPGDSEDDEDSSSSDDSESDDEPDLSRARRAGGSSGRKGDAEGPGKERKASPNAYEKQPRGRTKKEG